MRGQTPHALQSMYEAKQVFALRDAAGHIGDPIFYTGAVKVSLNELKAAEKDLGSVIDAAPHSTEAYEAHDLLANMYSRNGMYHEAFHEIVAALRVKPGEGDAKGMLPIVTALNKLPSMIIVERKPSKIQIEPDSTFIPLTIDGKDAEFFFDTGAGISVIGESEAKGLQLIPIAVSGKMHEASGTDVSGLQIALAKDLVIGNLHLKNVPFIVVADGGEPWIQLPQNKHGIIGIQILLAMQTLRWTPMGSLEFGFPAHDFRLAASNMLFSNSNPVIQVTVEDKHLDFTLDTGATGTDLNPPFAKALPNLIRTGQPEKNSIEGLGGSNTYDSVLLPSVTLEIDGQKLTLKPAHVFTAHGNGTWAAGNLGMDLLKQAHAFTLDFRAMVLHLE